MFYILVDEASSCVRVVQPQRGAALPQASSAVRDSTPRVTRAATRPQCGPAIPNDGVVSRSSSQARDSRSAADSKPRAATPSGERNQVSAVILLVIVGSFRCMAAENPFYIVWEFSMQNNNNETKKIKHKKTVVPWDTSKLTVGCISLNGERWLGSNVYFSSGLFSRFFANRSERSPFFLLQRNF